LYNFLGSVSSFFSSVLYIILALLVLMVMIVIHELGHYTAGKIFKFKINEFSIGFGKALFKRTSKKTGEVFAIRMIPLGGYCAFEGEDEDVESPDSFNKQAWWKRLIVLFSGAFFNFISAVIFSVVLLSVVGGGYSKLETVEINPTQYVVSGEVLQTGDVVTHVNGVKCSFLNGAFSGMVAQVNNDSDIITLTIERTEDGRKTTKEIQVKKKAEVATNQLGEPIKDKDGNLTYNYILGVTTSWYSYSFGESLLKAFPFACEMAWECLVILGKLVIGQYSLSQLGGPVTTISTIATASQTSMLNLLLLFPLIAVNLAVFNLLPIPALDGARMVFVTIEGIRRKPINRDLEAKIHGIGLIVLFSFVILVDLLQIFVF